MATNSYCECFTTHSHNSHEPSRLCVFFGRNAHAAKNEA